MSALGLRALSIYNPAGQDDEVLRAGYLARPQLLAELVEQLRRERPDSVAEHQLIIGQRGMGKTTLLHRLGLAVREDAELEARLLPLTFPEEQYSVGSLKDFWRNCLDALIDTVEARKLGDLDPLQAEQDRLERADQDADAALAVLLRAQQQHGRRLLLLVDNLDMLFERLDERESWSLRATLQRPGGPILVAAATHAPEDGFRYDRAFYDFLAIRWLEALRFDEVRTLLDQLAQRHDCQALRAELVRNPQRLIPLQLFTGGNPRTVMLLFRVLAQGLDAGVQKDVEDLLDLSTPLYKARIEALPLQQQRVFISVALAFDPVTAAQVEAQLKLGINTVSAQLNKLLKSGLLRHGPSAGKRLSFEVAERFFNIWYLMRANRRERHRMLWLARFLRGWYADDPQQLTSVAERLLQDDARPAAVHAVLEMTVGIAEALLVRRRAMDCLPAGQREGYENVVSTEEWDRFWRMLGQGQAAEAEAAIRQVIALDATDAWAWSGLGWALSNQAGRADEAERAYRRAIELDANIAWSWLGLGCLLSGVSGRAVEAEAAYRRAIEIDASDFWVWFKMGEFLAGVPDRVQEAEAAFRRATEIDASNFWVWERLGRLLVALDGRDEEAEAAFRCAIDLDAARVPSWLGLGLVLSRMAGRSDEAECAYRRAIEIDPTATVGWLELGRLISGNSERDNDAEVAFRHAIERDSSQVLAWLGLGAVLSRDVSRADEMEFVYRRAIEIDPVCALSWIGLVWALSNQPGRLDEAEAACRRAVELDAPNNLAWMALVDLWSRSATRLQSLGVSDLLPLFKAALQAQVPAATLEPLQQLLVQSGKAGVLWAALEDSGYAAVVLEQARPLAEAIRMLALDTTQTLPALAAEVREATFSVLQRIAPEFAARIAREHPALIASFTLPAEIAPIGTGAH